MRTVDFVTIMEEILKVPKGTLTMEDCPQTVEDWDSMAQVTLLATIDRELNVELPDDFMAQTRTAGQIVEALRARGALQD